MEGCRAWANSDDGFDISTTKQIYLSNNWSFKNGYLKGDGCGFKFGYSSITDPAKRVVRKIYQQAIGTVVFKMICL